MGQFSNVPLAIDNSHTVTQRTLDCGPGLGGLNQVYEPNHPTPSVSEEPRIIRATTLSQGFGDCLPLA